MGKPAKHVVPNDRGGWGVLTAGASRVGRTFATQEEAILAAKERAKRDGSELFIHGRDGKIRERSSYGRDPYPPKG